MTAGATIRPILQRADTRQRRPTLQEMKPDPSADRHFDPGRPTSSDGYTAGLGSTFRSFMDRLAAPFDGQIFERGDETALRLPMVDKRTAADL
jgi:hypothetical protein